MLQTMEEPIHRTEEKYFYTATPTSVTVHWSGGECQSSQLTPNTAYAVVIRRKVDDGPIETKKLSVSTPAVGTSGGGGVFTE